MTRKSHVSEVDGKVRSDMFYPAGFMDVVQIDARAFKSSLKGTSGQHIGGRYICVIYIYDIICYRYYI